jgi:hypothetical protein
MIRLLALGCLLAAPVQAQVRFADAHVDQVGLRVGENLILRGDGACGFLPARARIWALTVATAGQRPSAQREMAKRPCLRWPSATMSTAPIPKGRSMPVT